MIRLLQLSVFVLVANGLFAQGITSASIEGRVIDSVGGNPIAGARIVAVHNPTGTRYETVSQANGAYTFAYVRIGGPYTLTATNAANQEAKIEDIFLELDQHFNINIDFQEDLGELKSMLIVARANLSFSPARTGATTNIRRQQFDRLPTSGRNFQDLTGLDPRASGFSFAGRSNLYNNLSIDGSTLNNVFGSTALSGEQTMSQLVSLDAIEAIQVAISPYDVRQSSFSGAGVNAVTRSGSNKFEGSTYYFFKNQNTVGSKVGVKTDPLDDFAYQNFGFRLGGPIIRDKLFFFVNAEREHQVNRAVTYPVNTDGNVPTAVESGSSEYNSATNLERLRAFLVDPSKGWTFDPGTYDDVDVPTQSTKFLAKIDWNISADHKLMVRFNQTQSFRDFAPSNSGGIGAAPPGSRQNSASALPFSGSWYRQNINVQSVITELNSQLGRYSNVLTIGWSGWRDFRQQSGGEAVPFFPTVDILGPNGSNLTTFGPDPFAANNRLDQTIVQIDDNVNVEFINHKMTFGTANEIFKFTNVVTPQINGVYQYSSIQNFIDNVTAPTIANAPTQYLLQYSAGGEPGAGWSAMQLGVFAQDEYTGINNLRLILGLRLDLPVFNATLPPNEKSNAMIFNGGEKIRIDLLPNAAPLFSPRLGFNWDVLGDRSIQVRGGSGIFTSRLPFVWLSNQVTNNGLRFGSIVAPGSAAQAYNFSNTPHTSTGVSPTFAINAAVPDFKFPQVWRTNLGIDKKLPFGILGTLDAIFTKDVNAVYVRDANMNDAIRTVDGDGRPQFPATLNGDPTNPGRRINQTITQALVLDNSNKGYQLSLAAELKRKFSPDFELSGAYAITDARDINSQNLTSANGVFTAYPMAGDPNEAFMSYSGNYSTHKVVAVGSWRKEYFHHFASTISFTYKGNSGAPFSYTYGGDMNSDGITGNDLIYIPRVQNEILLTTTNASDPRTTAQIWNELDDYISQDKYLNKHRGEYAARNGATAPWIHLLNVRLLQDFNIGKNTLQLSVELINALNLINSSWGVVKTPTRSAGLLNFTGYEYPAVITPNTETNPLLPNNSTTTRAATGRPIFTFPVDADNKALTDSFSNSVKIESRYQFQLGIRYIFN